ncbi:MAG: hypothetical protein PHS54_01100 [Clostridia bacterium]|nr:hypothetical protein [Clostridia bacterium]
MEKDDTEKKQIEKTNKTKTDKIDLKTTTNKAVKKKKPSWIVWPIKILVITIFLSLAFSSLSELVLSNAGILVSVLIIVFLLIFGILSDMIGVATAACSIEPFTAMCSRKIKGSEVAMYLVKNAEKVSSICNDVIGDICGIISGAAGSVIAAKLILSTSIDSIHILIAASVSSIIAGLLIFGKALCKKYAMDNCTKVVLATGKFISIFNFKRK